MPEQRRANPRFQPDAFEANLELVRRVEAVAATRGLTSGQVALAWLQAQGPDVVPIPGTKRRTFLEENVSALAVELDPEELTRLDALAAQVTGARAPSYAGINREAPPLRR